MTAAAVLMLLAVACRPDVSTARGTADAFLRAYFGLDLQAASDASADHARELLAEERRLTAGQTVDADTHLPSITPTLVHEEPEAEGMVHLVYAVRIDASGDVSEQRWFVSVARADTQWKVVDFGRVPG